MYSLCDIEKYVTCYRPKGFLVDTCVLVLFLVGQYNSEFIEKSKLLGGYSAQDFDLLKKILFLFRGRDLFITTQVITELSNLSMRDGGIYGHRLEEYFGSIIYFLKSNTEYSQSMNCLYGMKITVLSTFGFTDMTLFEIAKKENIPIITDDKSFAIYAENEGVPVIDFGRIRAGEAVKS